MRRPLVMIVATIVLFSLTALTRAEALRMSVVNVSEQGCPVDVSGYVDFVAEKGATLPNSFRIALTADNVSTKDVLAMVININTTGTGKISLNKTRSEDYFFRDDLFKVNQKVELHDVSGPYGEPSANAMPELSQPRSTAMITFVQFADGSTWGDASKGRDIAVDRLRSMNELKLLATTYDTKGDEQFVTELKRPSSSSAVNYLQEFYERDANATKVFKRLTTILQSGDQRLSAIKQP
jgi:hypothetical protein